MPNFMSELFPTPVTTGTDHRLRCAEQLDTRSPNGLQYESMFNHFCKWMLALTALAWVLLAVPLYTWGHPMIVWAVVVGCLLSAICFGVGFFSVCLCIDQPQQKFMMVFFGGMLARLAFVGIVFFLILWLTPLHVLSFLASLMGFYVIYLILELSFVNSKFQNVKEG